VISNSTRKNIVSRAKRVVIKLGSYVLTTPSFKLDRKVFSDVIQTIAETRERNIETVLVSSGAIASAMGTLGLSERPKLIPQEQAAAAIGQISLMGLYNRLLGKHKIKAAQVLLTHSDLRNRQRFLNARHTLNSVLEYGAVPIINENDTTVVEEIRFGDNDYLSSLVTNLVQADLLIILTDIDGFYDRDPRKFDDAKLISLVENVDSSIEKLALGTKSKIARGGMATKIKAAKTAAHFGVPTIIANGKRKGTLSKILQGDDIGTLILPKQNKLTSRKHWIAFTLKPQGRITVDNGAKTAMVEKARSLLPSGITGVTGDFDPGEPVSCCDENGFEFARGLSAYSAEDIEKIKGANTSEIKKILGHDSPPEIINRDDMVILKGK
jgi:glutamate 5-kinase